MQIHWRFAKNAVANLGRGSAAAVVALLLPPVLVRHMTPASYAVWVLVLQTAAYVGYLNFGLQTAIGRYVAYANEKKDIEQRDAIFSTALAGLCCAALFSLACLAVAAVAAPAIFPSVPAPLIPPMRLALLLVGFSMAVELPASACNGVFAGMERYEIPALTVGGARLFSALGVIAAALAGRSLVVMAAILASTNLLSYLAQFLALRRLVPDLRFRRALLRRSTARELYGYCLGLTVMSFSMLLVTGLDLVLVGRFDFAVVAPYSVSAAMVTLISGLLYAVINVVMPHAAALHAREKAGDLGKLVITTTRISVLLLILSGMPMLIYAKPILHLWIGQRYVASGAPLLVILIVANIIRLLGAPYAIVLVAAGQQNYIKVSPLAEGISNFLASIALGALLGGIGVALGTLLGSFVSVASHLWYSMPRTRGVIDFSRRQFLLSGVLSPLVWTFPLVATAAVSLCGIPIHPVVGVCATLLSILGAISLMLRTKGLPKRNPNVAAISK
jgi:O-antigen/teichoic acid export membrane protein